MPFIPEILKNKSLSIVGLEKNTGKTVTLNYILRRLSEEGVPCAVTSIGVDGEQVDSVYATAKPEVTLYEGMRFITSEKHYHQRRLVSQILEVDERRTALGRLLTAEVLMPGKVLLSGASVTTVLQRQIRHLTTEGVGGVVSPLVIVDGALSRLSLASPVVTDAMVLATGAALSASMPQLIARTAFTVSLIALPSVEEVLVERLQQCTSGIWAVDNNGEVHDLEIPSVFLLAKQGEELFRFGTRIFVAGAVSDRLFSILLQCKEVKDIELIVRDFTRLFVEPRLYSEFCRKGGKVTVLQRSHLVAVTVNPTSPQGFRMHSEELCRRLQDQIGLPVYDVCRLK